MTRILRIYADIFFDFLSAVIFSICVICVLFFGTRMMRILDGTRMMRIFGILRLVSTALSMGHSVQVGADFNGTLALMERRFKENADDADLADLRGF